MGTGRLSMQLSWASGRHGLVYHEMDKVIRKNSPSYLSPNIMAPVVALLTHSASSINIGSGGDTVFSSLNNLFYRL